MWYETVGDILQSKATSLNSAPMLHIVCLPTCVNLKFTISSAATDVFGAKINIHAFRIEFGPAFFTLYDPVFS